MKAKLSLYLFLLVAITSCKEDIVKETSEIEGTFTGTFIRSSPNARYAPSEVTLTFSDGEFQGDSETVKYPAICNGTFLIEGENITFSNSCPWTAEFDWTLILSGEFTYEWRGEELVIEKRNGDLHDYYFLTRQNL